MSASRDLIRKLGDDTPILADGRRAPDRREVSLRWLTGAFLTGVTSSALMGVALFAALDGREQLAMPAEAVASVTPDTAADGSDAPAEAVKGRRVVAPVIAAKPTDKTIMEVSTLIREGDRDVVRKQPFVHVKMALAASHPVQETYPDFDPMKIFASGDTNPPAADTGVIYGAQVDSEVSLRTVDFPVAADTFKYASSMTLEEVEQTVRSNGSALTDGTVQVASLYYVDPRRFADTATDLDFSAGLNARVITENVSVAPFEASDGNDVGFGDDIIPIRADTTMKDAMENAGYDDSQSGPVIQALLSTMNTTVLHEGDVLRLGVDQTRDKTRIIRASVYTGRSHVATVALNDRGFFVAGAEPEHSDAIDHAFDGDAGPAAAVARGDLPRVYDGVYRAALSYGMRQDMVQLIVKLLASSVDFKAQLKPTDTLEAFFSAPDDKGRATKDSQLLFVDAHFGGNDIRFYRFQDPSDGSVDYYDQDGKSIRTFLIRNPVPNGIFRSPFGMRRHPILGYSRMHWGVDWAAPRGTPILAAGDGVVEKAGWDSGGFGNQTIIRHANGYESSYNHQSAIAKGVVPGATVHQGQVIGYIGSTGLATGPHLHYEMMVNGTKVDPLRVRFPDRKPLADDALVAFERERKRIDDLLKSDSGKTPEVASR